MEKNKNSPRYTGGKGHSAWSAPGKAAIGAGQTRAFPPEIPFWPDDVPPDQDPRLTAQPGPGEDMAPCYPEEDEAFPEEPFPPDKNMSGKNEYEYEYGPQDDMTAHEDARAFRILRNDILPQPMEAVAPTEKGYRDGRWQEGEDAVARKQFDREQFPY